MTREENRRAFPFAAEWLDVLKRGGIEARVLYARNGDVEVGERFDARCRREGWVSCEYLRNGARA